MLIIFFLLLITVGKDCAAANVMCVDPLICPDDICLIPGGIPLTLLLNLSMMDVTYILAGETCIAGEERFCETGTTCEDQECKLNGK